MIGLQVVFGVMAVCAAASRLKARETNPNWLDPTRGYRPSCGDDPILWREYELPMRRGGSSVLVFRLRYLLILLKVLLLNVLALVGMLILLAIPLGLLTASAHKYAVWAIWRDGPWFDILASVLVLGLPLPRFGVEAHTGRFQDVSHGQARRRRLHRLVL